MVEAARSAPVPTVDYERMYAALRQRWIGRRSTRRDFRMHWHWAVAVAISFCIGGWVGHLHHQLSTGSVSRAGSSPRAMDGNTLGLNQELEAGAEPIVVGHAGVAQWTLAPEGKARLAIQGRYLTVRLDVGRIDAEVVPSNQPESFAVEAGTLRVAVHGTRFAVEKIEGFIDVTVTEGTVVVGSKGQPGQTSGTILNGAPKRTISGSANGI